ncbi:MAG: hypothetical protein WBV85_06305 [Solirubrobacteraceae bacterium]
MSAEHGREVPVTFTDGVRHDVTSLVASLTDEKASAALKRRIAELLVECNANPYVGELMSSGRHPELADCRRVRFDIPTYKGKPRFRLMYRNEPSDGAPAECLWLTVGPRAGLRAHRVATQRLRRRT